MTDFFPHGFWSSMTLVGMVVFLLFGLDLLLGARFVLGMSRFVNKKFQVDQAVIHLLENLKKASDREFDVESSLLRGWGRFVAGGMLIGASFLLFNLHAVLK